MAHCPHCVFSPLFSRGDIDRRAFQRAPPPSATGAESGRLRQKHGRGATEKKISEAGRLSHFLGQGSLARASRASSRRIPAAAHARSTSGRCAAAHSLTHAASGASHGASHRVRSTRSSAQHAALPARSSVRRAARQRAASVSGATWLGLGLGLRVGLGYRIARLALPSPDLTLTLSKGRSACPAFLHPSIYLLTVSAAEAPPPTATATGTCAPNSPSGSVVGCATRSRPSPGTAWP